MKFIVLFSKFRRNFEYVSALKLKKILFISPNNLLVIVEWGECWAHHSFEAHHFGFHLDRFGCFDFSLRNINKVYRNLNFSN